MATVYEQYEDLTNSPIEDSVIDWCETAETRAAVFGGTDPLDYWGDDA